jgi:CheY-like chemotaxis protein
MALGQILIIDDSDADLFFAELTLQATGIAQSVLSFGIATEALEYLRQPQGLEASVILLDINMPEMNGFEFLDAYESLCSTSV